MKKADRRAAFLYKTDGAGKHDWDILTQKPFTEFEHDLNQSYENSWGRFMVTQTWEGKKVTFGGRFVEGAIGEAVWGNGKVLVTLHIYGVLARQVERKLVFEVGQMLSLACHYARTEEIEAENKESLRLSALDTYRDTYANEVEAGLLIARWQTADEFTKVATALTSSTSAVAGWLQWQAGGTPTVAWKIFAGTAAVLSIVHVALKVSDRVKDWSDTKGHFVRLRTELETLLYRMKVNPAFDLETYTEKFEALRVRYGEGVDRKKVDPLNFWICEKATAEAQEKYLAMARRTELPEPAGQ